MPRVFSPTGFNVIFARFHLLLNQDFQDFQDYRGRLRFGCKVIRKGLLYTLFFADALRIGESLRYESTVK